MGGVLPQKQQQKLAGILRWRERSEGRSAGMHGFVDQRAVRGAEHRRRCGERPAGARRWIAALAQQYTDVLSAQPRNAEKHRGV